MNTAQIIELKGAKSIRYSVQVDGVEYARVISRPLAEKVAALVDEHTAKVDAAIASLKVGH